MPEYLQNFKKYAADLGNYILHERGSATVVAAAASSSIAWGNLFTRTENPWYATLEILFGALAIGEGLRCCRRREYQL